MALRGIADAKLGTVLLEDGPVLLVGPPTEGVGKDILVSWNPGCLPLETTFDLGCGKMAGHL